MRRVVGAAVALMLVLLVLPVAAGAAARDRHRDERVPSAHLEATGAGSMTVTGRLAVNGSIARRGSLVVTDRAGDASAYLAGAPLRFDRRGQARVRRASGILYVTGSEVSVQVQSGDLTFAVAGVGRVRLSGDGTYTLNDEPEKAWSGSWIRLVPPRDAGGGRRPGWRSR
jgi:hypothetical protein